MARKLFLWLLLCTALWASQVPAPYARLGQALADERQVVEVLQREGYFKTEEAHAFLTAVDGAFALGHAAEDGEGCRSRACKAAAKAYLKALRGIEPIRKKIYREYEAALNAAMEKKDTAAFKSLLNHGLEPLQRPRLREAATDFYAAHRKAVRCEAGEALLQARKVDKYSRRVARQERDAYRENLAVKTVSATRSVKEIEEAGHVLISTENTPQGFRFIAENLNAFPVTVKLSFTELENLRATQTLPVVFELEGKNKREDVLQLQVRDRRQPARFRSSYGWVRGSASARHNDAILYRVPFERGKKVFVSQGYAGEQTHTGDLKHSVDFGVPEGTPIYAARGGKVVDTESKNTKNGYSEAFAQYANYVVILHNDGTFGNYYHLKPDGVAVRVGENVRAGELVGYSGNTGYSNGPHLHFSVTTVAPGDRLRPVTVLVRFETLAGIVSWPRAGDWFAVK